MSSEMIFNVQHSLCWFFPVGFLEDDAIWVNLTRGTRLGRVIRGPGGKGDSMVAVSKCNRTTHNITTFILEIFICKWKSILIRVGNGKQASLQSSFVERALARDKRCIFTGDSPTSNSDNLALAIWLFPPFLRYTVSTNNPCTAIMRYGSYRVVGQLSDESYLDRKYHDHPDACDLGEFIVVTNAISGRQDVVALF